MEQESPVAFKIAEVITMGMGLIAVSRRPGKGHCLGRLLVDADMIEVNGMV